MITSVVLTVLTLLGAAGCVLAVARLRRRVPGEGGGAGLLHGLVGVVTAGAMGLFVYRWVGLGRGWNPLGAHVDGLTLIAALLGMTLWYVQTRPRLLGLAAFGLPVLTFVLLWAVCASWWTYRPFRLETLHPVWRAVHLAGVYLGTLGAAVAAAAGAMYLYAEGRMKRKVGVLEGIGDRGSGFGGGRGGVIAGTRGVPGGGDASAGRLASLEALERVIQQASGLGFGLLTLGLVSGVVVMVGEPGVLGGGGTGWWYGPKVGLAVAAWGVYALLMNVRHASAFRGRRAAWLAIGGLVLLVTVYGLVTAGYRDQGSGIRDQVSVCWPVAVRARGGVLAGTRSVPGERTEPSQPSGQRLAASGRSWGASATALSRSLRRGGAYVSITKYEDENENDRCFPSPQVSKSPGPQPPTPNPQHPGAA